MVKSRNILCELWTVFDFKGQQLLFLWIDFKNLFNFELEKELTNWKYQYLGIDKNVVKVDFRMTRHIYKTLKD